MVGRTDGMQFPTQAQVNPSLCVSCGICVGACPSSTPFRRTEDLKTGIDLPDYSLEHLRDETIATAATLQGPSRVLVLACAHGGASNRQDGTIVLPCVAMMPPSLIDFVLSRNLADGVVVAGCAESSCYNRLGVKWLQERFNNQRDPYLRKRVPRERLALIWASPLAQRTVQKEIEEFAQRVQALPPMRTRSLAPFKPEPEREPSAMMEPDS